LGRTQHIKSISVLADINTSVVTLLICDFSTQGVNVLYSTLRFSQYTQKNNVQQDYVQMIVDATDWHVLSKLLPWQRPLPEFCTTKLQSGGIPSSWKTINGYSCSTNNPSKPS